MATIPRFRTLLSILAVAVLLGMAPAAQACSVCFGDPDSPMTKGAAAGVIVLGVVVYGTLFGFVGIAITWARRARRLSQSSDVDSDQGA